MIEELIILTNIIFITIILTADNAVIVGSIASNFVPKNRKQIILWGVIGAFVFKIFFAIFATFLFEFYFVKILGGLLLIWIVNDLRKDLLDIKKVAKIAKKILKTKAPITPQRIICFLFFGTKFEAIDPTITALSAVNIIVIKIIFVKIMSSSIKIFNI